MDTGNGTTISLGTTGDVGTVKSLTLPKLAIDKLETSDLETEDFKKYIGTDLVDPGELQVEVFLDQTDDDFLTYTNGSDDDPVFGVSQNVTITFPLSDESNTTNASLAGTGFIKEIDLPGVQNGELLMLTYTIAYDSDTALNYTKEEA